MACECTERAHDDPFRHSGHVTVRRTTVKERKAWESKWPQLRMGRYIVVKAEDPELMMLTFMLPNTADTREEAVFWAERIASKSDYGYVAPEGWEKVKGRLPEEKE